MADYIDRKLAKRLFANDHDYGLAKRLDEVPTADVVEVRRGRWEVHPKDTCAAFKHLEKLRCTNCWHFLYHNYGDDKNYCPNCGAKMDGE